MIKELCEKLKQKRRDLGYSIEYVVERTKLHPSMIRDIEEGNLINENPVYVKGFIKIYAAFLKVDMISATEAVDSTDSSLKAKDNKTRRINNSIFLNRVKAIIKKIFFAIKNKIIVILFVAFLLWLLFTVSSFIIRKIGKLFTGSKSVQRQEQKEESQVAPVSLEGEELVATLTAKKNCFLKVMVDGKLLFDGQLAEGAIETWRGDKEIEMKIRDGSAIALEVNGKDIPTLTSLRKPIKSLKITPSGIVIDK
ncbi:MAG: DUF4115 domain-containing protein [Candidatus Susulua stagnicola]|nr:DUF4115 domain-containing protein [Candidatus Susulua stagnicola]